METERRAHTRKLVSTAVTFHDSVGGVALRGWLRDISRGGCFIATPSLLTFGEEVDVSLMLPYPRVAIAGKARVMWVRETNEREAPAGMGVRFETLTPEMIAAIDKITSAARLSRPNTVIGIAPPAVGSAPSYSDVRISIADPEVESAPIASPLAPIEPPEPKKSGRDRMLIAAAAGVSLLGLVGLGIFWARHDRSPTTQADAAPSATVAEIAEASEPPMDASPATTPPSVDAAAADASPHHTSTDGGKKKRKRPRRHH
ncbi:MAG TPA: PilZ domain-containing protein [Polyangiaceae bacterium]